MKITSEAGSPLRDQFENESSTGKTIPPANEFPEVPIYENITKSAFMALVERLESKKDFLRFKKDFFKRKTRIIPDKTPLFRDATAKSELKHPTPLDPHFKKINSEDLFVDAEHYDLDMEETFQRLEEAFDAQEAAESQNQKEQTAGEVSNDSDETPEASDLISSIPPEAYIVPEEQAESAAVQPKPEPAPSASKELNEENISAAASLDDLAELLRESTGIESPTEGHFSGEDIMLLIDKVANKEAYIEEITRKNGLREKVWDLIKREKGILPKSIEREEEEAIKANLEKSALDHEALKKSNMPVEPLLPLEKKDPTKAKSLFAPITQGFKKLFGFGRKKSN